MKNVHACNLLQHCRERELGECITCTVTVINIMLIKFINYKYLIQKITKQELHMCVDIERQLDLITSNNMKLYINNLNYPFVSDYKVIILKSLMTFWLQTEDQLVLQ